MRRRVLRAEVDRVIADFVVAGGGRMDEAGVAGFSGGTWFGVLAPASTPPAVVARLNKEIAAILRAPDVVQTFTDRGIEPIGNSAAEFRAFIEAESRRWLKVAQDAGVKPE